MPQAGYGQAATQAAARHPAPRERISPADWPAPWQDLFRRTRPGRVAWTYFGLGYDLCGYPNDQRRAHLAGLIRFLRMPAGTHTFWPVGLPAMDEDNHPVLNPDPAIFWQGLHALGSRVLIVMGSPAARAIGIPGRLEPNQPLQAYNGVRLLITWDIDSLDDGTHMRNTCTYLQSMLQRLL